MSDPQRTRSLPLATDSAPDPAPARSVDGVRSVPPQLAALSQQLDQQSGPEYWRTLDELARTPEFEEYLHREFPENASQWTGASRRSFLKLMGASLALAGVTGCDIRQPRETIVPYVHTPAALVPGLPLYFCTSCEISGSGVGLVVQSRMGRPIKVEGNPRHPASLGATGIFAQAAPLDLYDPDRARAPSRRGELTTLKALRAHFAAAGSQWDETEGRGLRILNPPTSSPTYHRLLDAVRQRWPQAKCFTYEPVVDDNLTSGNRLIWGDEQTADAEPVYHFDRASVMVSLGADVLGARDTPPSWVTDFAAARRVAGRQRGDGSGQIPEHMLRLYALTPTPTLTGAKADHRLTVAPPAMLDAVVWLARRLGVSVGETERTSTLSEAQIGWLERCAADLEEPRGSDKAPVIVAGREQPPLVHALAYAINGALGAIGKTVEIIDRPWRSLPGAPASSGQVGSLAQLTEEMLEGRVETLLILDGNPVFDAPADVPFGQALAEVPDSLHLSSFINETAALCRWHVPQSHFLESWGDTRAPDGTAAIVQPLIEPLYASMTPIELLGQLVGQPDRFAEGQPEDPVVASPAVANGYELVRQTWRQQYDSGGADDFDTRWHRWLQRGVVDAAPGENADSRAPSSAGQNAQAQNSDSGAASASGSEPQRRLPPGFTERIAAAVKERSGSGNTRRSQPPAEEPRFHLLFRPDPTIWDGRFANNGWLQELPKPLTKVTWDNVVLVSLEDAARLDVASGDLVQLRRGDRHVTLPVWVIPGQADGTLTAFFGYGRRRAGRVAADTGFDVYPLRTTDAMWVADDVTVSKLDERYPVVSTQHHHLMEDRHIVRSGTLEELKKAPEHPEFVHPGKPAPATSFYPPWPESEPRWGMTIDLTACTGCSACVIACQAENNIPVVGKEEVGNNREMHWIRVDTYYSGPSKDPATTHHQPVPCMHCELAPCEVVCPVAATAHSEDGLNQMIYNRCVGTRYCSNNCPYKVRRFNFFDYGERFYEQPSQALLANPEVTVRTRGVMEKCTYCVQRIKAAQADAELEDRELRDGEVVTACQSVCPARAIEFGDLSDSNSQVHQMHHHPLNYALLGELNTRPRTTYLAEVKNPVQPHACGEPEELDG